jgi:hypothetical protein
MSWDTAVTDLRKKLGDNSSDKLSWRKTVFGAQNGVNTAFKTYEWRRVTDFSLIPSDNTGVAGVYVDNAKVTVSTDDLTSGQFSLAVAPTNGQTVEASYYNQWFVDDELIAFLTSASNWMAFADSYVNIPFGLRPAALEYATADAFQQLSLRWRQMGEMYRVEDLPRESIKSMIKEYEEAAEKAYTNATAKRNEYYDNRQGEALQPLSVSLAGRVPNPQPKR